MAHIYTDFIPCMDVCVRVTRTGWTWKPGSHQVGKEIQPTRSKTRRGWWNGMSRQLILLWIATWITMIYEFVENWRRQSNYLCTIWCFVFTRVPWYENNRGNNRHRLVLFSECSSFLKWICWLFTHMHHDFLRDTNSSSRYHISRATTHAHLCTYCCDSLFIARGLTIHMAHPGQSYATLVGTAHLFYI